MNYTDFAIEQEAWNHKSLTSLFLTLQATINNVLPEYHPADRLKRLEAEVYDLLSKHNKRFSAYPLHSGKGSNHIWINEAYAERVRERVIIITFKTSPDA